MVWYIDSLVRLDIGASVHREIESSVCCYSGSLVRGHVRHMRKLLQRTDETTAARGTDLFSLLHPARRPDSRRAAGNTCPSASPASSASAPSASVSPPPSHHSPIVRLCDCAYQLPQLLRNAPQLVPELRLHPLAPVLSSLAPSPVPPRPSIRPRLPGLEHGRPGQGEQGVIRRDETAGNRRVRLVGVRSVRLMQSIILFINTPPPDMTLTTPYA